MIVVCDPPRFYRREDVHENSIRAPRLLRRFVLLLLPRLGMRGATVLFGLLASRAGTCFSFFLVATNLRSLKEKRAVKSIGWINIGRGMMPPVALDGISKK